MAQDTPDTPDRKTGCFRIIIGPPTEAGALEALLEATLSGAPDRKVLVIEADPDRAAKLETQLPQAQVIAAAVGAQAGEAELVQYNFPGLAGITPPLPALSAILPGLREVSRKQTAMIGVDAVVKWLGKRGAAGPLDLYIDAPGSEMAILDGIAAAGLLAVCARLRLRCGAEPMFEQAAGRDALLERCLAEGLKLVQEETDDPDFPEMFFEVDLAARALEEARSELAKLKRKSTADKAQITKLKKEQAATAAQLEEATQASTTEQAQKTAAQAQIATLTTQLEALQAEVGEEQQTTSQIRDALHKRNGELEARSKAMEEARTAHEATLAELKAELEEEQNTTQQVRAALHKRNGELEARSKAMEEARTAHEAALTELQAQLDKVRDEMKTASEADRKNLVQVRDKLNKRNSELEAVQAQADTQAVELEAQAKALKSAKKKLAKREAKLETSAAELAEALTQIDRLEGQVRSLEEAQKTGQQNLAQARDTLNKRSLALETRTKELEDARAEAAQYAGRPSEPDADTLAQLEQSKADLAVALRMQMLAQSDLRDLQARFREVSQARAAQQTLLEKLTPRLQQAAQQLQHMQLVDAEPRADIPRLEAAQTEAEIVPEADSKPSAKRATKSGAKSKSKSKTTSKRASRTSKTTKS